MYTAHQTRILGDAKEPWSELCKADISSNTELHWTCNDRINDNLKVDVCHQEGVFTAVSMKAAFTTRLQNCERFTEINSQVLQDSC